MVLEKDLVKNVHAGYAVTQYKPARLASTENTQHNFLTKQRLKMPAKVRRILGMTRTA